MKVSVIIVNYKSWISLAACLDSLLSCINQDSTMEVIVVDNASSDGELAAFKAKYPEINFIENAGNFGFANACNLGAKNAIGEYLLFLNPDTQIESQVIQALEQALTNNHTLAIVSCKQVNQAGRVERVNRIFPNIFSLFSALKWMNGLRKPKIRFLEKYNNRAQLVDWVSGSLVMISKTWFNKIDGWSEDYWMYYEDIDLCKRVAMENGEIAVLLDHSILHNHGGASRINLQTKRLTKLEVVKSKHVYMAKYIRPKPIILIATVVEFIEKMLLAIIGIVAYPVKKLRLHLFIFLDLLKYYNQAAENKTWLSLRSTNHIKKKK